jgi:hypothetical protein
MRFHDYSKYKNKPVVIDGLWFRSKREGQRYAQLRLLEKAGDISHLKTQVRFPLVVNDEKICTYVSDFTYRYKGKDIVEDTKGFKTEVYKIKAKLMWAIRGIEIKES